LVQKKRVLGRDQIAAASKLFIKGWSEKFIELCGKALDEVVRVCAHRLIATSDSD
jgi:hypothetical protein